MQTDPIQLTLTIQSDPIQLDWIGSVWMIGFGLFWAHFLVWFFKECVNKMCQLHSVMRTEKFNNVTYTTAATLMRSSTMLYQYNVPTTESNEKFIIF